VTVAEEDHNGNVLTAVRATDAGAPLKLITANPQNPRGLPPQELFNLASDPHEQTPLENPEVVQRLTQSLNAALEQSRKGGGQSGERVLDPEAEAQLRALGYR
jgi:hypothetical protein